MTEEDVRTIVKEEIRIAIADLLKDIVETFDDCRPITSPDGQTCYGYATRYSIPQQVFEELLKSRQ